MLEDSSGQERTPCPRCGSVRRVFHEEVTTVIKIYDSSFFKHKDPKKTGKAKVLAEGFNGYEYSHSHQKIVAKRWLIDRQNNLYKETITDVETGYLIHTCEEALTDHKGHGSAKQNSRGSGD